MDEWSLAEDQRIRLSDSPASSLKVVPAPTSPAHSIHLEPMEPMDLQPDPGMRTTDFFDDSSSDDEAVAAGRSRDGTPALESDARKRTPTSAKKDQGSYLGTTTATDFVSHCGDDQTGTPSAEPTVYKTLFGDGFLKLTSTPGPDAVKSPPLPSRNPGRDPRIVPGNPTPPPKPGQHSDSSSDRTAGDEAAKASQARYINFQSSGKGRLVTSRSPRVSDALDENTAATVLGPLTKEEQILGAHAITLQALLGDREGLQGSSARNSKEIVADTVFRMRSASNPSGGKRVNIVPPPVDVSSPRNPLPDDYVRTPYPLSYRHSQPKPSPLSIAHGSPEGPEESILALSIRRHERDHFTLSRRVSQLIIPADLSIKKAKLGSPGTKEKHFEVLDFDDCHLFTELRATYARLASPFRFFSARTLHRIEISHSGCSYNHAHSHCVAPAAVLQSPSCCQHAQSHAVPRSPRFTAQQDLTDSFSTAGLMAQFRNPGAGKARYAWVHWAHRLAASNPLPPHWTPPAPPPPADSPSARLVAAAKIFRRSSSVEKTGRSDEEGRVSDTSGLGPQGACAVGLEFVEGWSMPRILVAVAVVLVLAVAGTLLWLFLGVSFLGGAGYRGAGSRVGESMLVGLLVLLLGWTLVGAWMGISWIVE